MSTPSRGNFRKNRTWLRGSPGTATAKWPHLQENDYFLIYGFFDKAILSALECEALVQWWSDGRLQTETLVDFLVRQGVLFPEQARLLDLAFRGYLQSAGVEQTLDLAVVGRLRRKLEQVDIVTGIEPQRDDPSDAAADAKSTPKSTPKSNPLLEVRDHVEVVGASTAALGPKKSPERHPAPPVMDAGEETLSHIARKSAPEPTPSSVGGKLLGVVVKPKTNAASRVAPGGAGAAIPEAASVQEPVTSAPTETVSEIGGSGRAKVKTGGGSSRGSASGRSSPRIPKMAVGHRLGKCLLTEQMDQDGLCMAFRAFHESLCMPIVVKVINLSRLGGIPLQVEILEDIRKLAQFSHPHILRIWDYHADDHLPYLLMDDFDGSSMADLVDMGLRFRPERALQIVAQLMEGLWVAHQYGLTHRELSPSKVCLPKNGPARVADLGLTSLAKARAQLILDNSRTHFSALGRSAAHMAPELARGLDSDHRGDIYSLGTIFYHAIVGEPPFVGLTPMDTLVKQVYEQPVAPHLRVKELPEIYSSVILKMMAKEPDDRYQTYDDLRDALVAVALQNDPNQAHTKELRSNSSFWKYVLAFGSGRFHRDV